jgi:hypothetical protein
MSKNSKYRGEIVLRYLSNVKKQSDTNSLCFFMQTVISDILADCYNCPIGGFTYWQRANLELDKKRQDISYLA